jgi:hypothetical protein
MQWSSPEEWIGGRQKGWIGEDTCGRFGGAAHTKASLVVVLETAAAAICMLETTTTLIGVQKSRTVP